MYMQTILRWLGWTCCGLLPDEEESSPSATSLRSSYLQITSLLPSGGDVMGLSSTPAHPRLPRFSPYTEAASGAVRPLPLPLHRSRPLPIEASVSRMTTVSAVEALQYCNERAPASSSRTGLLTWELGGEVVDLPGHTSTQSQAKKKKKRRNKKKKVKQQQQQQHQENAGAETPGDDVGINYDSENSGAS